MSNAIKIAIENVQAIEKAEIEVEGFTGIVGRSNTGKSSLIRAFYAAVTNKSPKGIFRHGTTESVVKIDDDEKNIHIKWEKGESVSTTYTLNGDKFTKGGKEPPSKIAEWGFHALKIGDETLDVQVAKQFNALFLLDKSGGFVADFISKITKADILTGAMKDCETDYRKANESVKFTDKELDQLNSELKKFCELDYHQLLIKALVEDKQRIQKENAVVGELDGYIAHIENLRAETKKLEVIPEFDDTFDGAPNLADLKTLSAWCDEVDEGKTKLIAARKVDACELPEVHADIDFLKDAEKYFELISMTSVALPELVACEMDLTDIKELDSHIQAIAAIQTDTAEIVSGLSTVESKIETLTAENSAMEQQLGKCPLCKHSFDMNHKAHDAPLGEIFDA